MAIDVSNTPDMYSISIAGSFTFNTSCRVRNTPDMNDSGVATYTSGMSVSYDSKLKNGNHLWLSYIATSGTRHYIPYVNTDTGVYFGTDSNSVDPIKTTSGTTETSSTTGTLGSLTGQAGADVADQTPDGTIYTTSGTFTFKEAARGRNNDLMMATKGDSFGIGDAVIYNAKIKSDGHYWLRYSHYGSGTYYVPYATITPFRNYGSTDTNPGDPVYPQDTLTGETGHTGGTTSDNPINFVKSFGAVSGLSETNCTINNAAFTKLAQFNHSGIITVHIPAGVYMVNRPILSSNVHFIGDDGAMFVGTASMVEDAKGHYGSAFQYDGVTNITWENIIFKGLPSPAENNVRRLVHSILSSSYITFIKCSFDQNEGNGNHSIDIGGSHHIYVKDCSFIAVGASTSSIIGKHFYKECIQTDYDYLDGVSAVPSKSHTYTNAPTHDVFVDNCRFLPLYANSSASQLIKYGPLPIGTHSSVPNKASMSLINSIQMTNCLIVDPKPTNSGGFGYYGTIHFPAAENITISNNQIERRKTQVSPSVFMFYNYKKGSKITNNGFYICNNKIFNMNPQLVHVTSSILADKDNANAPVALKYAPSYALFTVGSAHKFDDIHFDNNQIFTAASDLTPADQDGKTIAEKAQNIHDSSNLRVKGVGAINWTHNGNTRTAVPSGMSGNEAAHPTTTQKIYAVLPNQQKVLMVTANISKNLPYNVSLGNYGSYHPAVSTATVGYDSPDGNIYMPYL